MRFEIFDKEIIKAKFKSDEDHTKEYCKHIGMGASGSFDSKTGIGIIRSFRKQVELLRSLGYKNLNFDNGGDNDHLVVDHEKKEFGFFEGKPYNLEKWRGSLRDLWNTYS